MSGISYVWSQIWPNLLASLITFIAASVWHLTFVKRMIRDHEDTVRRHLTGRRPPVETDQEEP